MELLERLAQYLGVSKTAAIEMALRKMWRDSHLKSYEMPKPADGR